MDQVTNRLDQIRTQVGGGSNVIFLLVTHFFFSAWTELAQWHGSNLNFMNTFLILSLAWSLHDRVSTSPPFCALLIECLGVLNDIIVLSIFFPSYTRAGGQAAISSTKRFSAVMAIFNLIVRFWGILLCHGEYSKRSDALSGPGPVTTDGGGGGIYAVEKAMDVSYNMSGRYSTTPGQLPNGSRITTPMPPTSGAPVQHPMGGHPPGAAPRPGSAASSHVSGYGYSQTPYQGAPGPHVKTDPLPDIPPSYKQHT